MKLQKLKASKRIYFHLLWFLLVCFFYSVTDSSFARSTKIVTWNVKDALSVDDVRKRTGDFRNFHRTIGADIILLQEVTSYNVVLAIRDAMEIRDYHAACSNFMQNNFLGRRSFEVAILSKYKINRLIEYDPTPDNRGGYLDEIKLEPVLKIGVRRVKTSRGFLWAKIDKLNLILSVVHLKSSRGYYGLKDARNAKKREFVMAAVARSTLEDLHVYPGYTSIIAGDFNVGHSDKKKCFAQVKTGKFAKVFYVTLRT